MDVSTRRIALVSLQRQTRFYRLVSMVLALTSFLLAVTLTVRGWVPERVVIVPAEIRDKFWVEEGQVSRSYFLEWGYYVTMLVLNVTPASVAYQNDVLLRHVATEYREGLRLELAEAARRLQDEGLSTFFSVTDVHVREEQGQVAFAGVLASYVAGRKISEQDASYMAEFRVENGRLHLLRFAETDPVDVFRILAT